jgi:hypothetical protein
VKEIKTIIFFTYYAIITDKNEVVSIELSKYKTTVKMA